jgi:UDP-2-acetamido-3-amino-2,3-dideoxy-glucuronate N-acetyltransferase
MRPRIHPAAHVMSSAVGDGTQVWQNVVILEGAIVGRDCNINAHCLVEGDARIGDRVTLKCGVYVWNGVTLADDVFVGPNATFTNDLAPRSKQRPERWETTIVHRGASIGAAATLLCGIEIGEYAMIGAASLVTKSVPPHTLWAGSPATARGFVCRCGAKLDDDMRCPRCGDTYVTTPDGGARRNG